jgi:DNA-directed RNA polymerase specialized sigma24 family protein
MGRLSADQREVLLLAAVEELRYDEIAASFRSGRQP